MLSCMKSLRDLDPKQKTTDYWVKLGVEEVVLQKSAHQLVVWTQIVSPENMYTCNIVGTQ